jgi:hypothetical protein
MSLCGSFVISPGLGGKAQVNEPQAHLGFTFCMKSQSLLFLLTDMAECFDQKTVPSHKLHAFT